MSPKSTAILSNPDARGHIVYPYTDQTQVADAVCLFATAGLQKGDAVLLVMTHDHREPIRRRLEEQGFNLKELEGTGQPNKQRWCLTSARKAYQVLDAAWLCDLTGAA
jgi:hypothetical protein